MSKNMRKGDEVIVIAGNDRGKVGKILSLAGDRVLVEGINVRKKHMKPTQQNQKGQIINIERPIHASNVSHCVDGKAIKLRVRFNSKGEKELYHLKESAEVLYRTIKGKAPVKEAKKAPAKETKTAPAKKAKRAPAKKEKSE